MNHTEVAAVAGYVKSTKFNYLTALREIDYTLGQDLYKRAQTHVNFLMVIPGCAGAFKTSLFRDRTVTIEHDTLTEDLDFTYKIHKFGLRVGYEPRAVVYTQDPHTLNSYINQMRRWFGGGWQNLLKHYKIMFQAPGAALQLTMSYLEGLIFSIIFFVLPLINIVLFLQFQLILLCVSLGAGIYAAIRRKRLDLFLYSPLLLVLRGINSWIFIEQLFSEVIFGKKRSIWFQPERRTETLEASLLPHRL
jgi:cellulose synthase/poly-beta-1,6-N-acetylglucosamine synthase-like glycosyltransferase